VIYTYSEIFFLLRAMQCLAVSEEPQRDQPVMGLSITVQIKPPPSPASAKLGRAPVHAGTLAISLCGHSRLSLLQVDSI
jgi:hypothetical protein